MAWPGVGTRTKRTEPPTIGSWAVPFIPEDNEHREAAAPTVQSFSAVPSPAVETRKVFTNIFVNLIIIPRATDATDMRSQTRTLLVYKQLAEL